MPRITACVMSLFVSTRRKLSVRMKSFAVPNGILIGHDEESQKL